MAESRIDVFIRLRDQISGSLKAIRDNFKAVTAEAERLDEQSTANVRQEYDRLEKEITDIRAATERTNASLDTIRNAGLAIAGLGAALAAPFVIGLRATSQFSREIAEIGTLVDDSVQSTEQLRQTVIDLSNEFGASRSDIASGLYQAISSGAAAGAEANEVLRVALITARGGVTSVRAAVDGLSTVLNSFGLEARDAEQVADALFVTVKNGRTTIDELSSFLFQAAPVASQLGVSYQELNAALVTLTKQGVPTRVAFTQIRSAINGIVRDTPELTKVFEEFGGAQRVIQEQGLAKALQLVRDAANGNVGVLNKLLGSIEGVGAVLGLTGSQLEEFQQQLRDQVNASGDAQRAADEVAESFGEQLRIAIERTGNAFEALGNLVAPIITPIVRGVGDLAVAFQELLASSAVARFFTGLVAVAGLLLTTFGSLVVTLALTARGFVFLQGSLAIVTRRFQQATIQATLMQTALRGIGVAARFALGPLGLALTALSVFIGVVQAATDDTEDLVDANNELADSFETLSDIDQQRAFERQGQLVEDLQAKYDELKEKKDALDARGGARGGRQGQNQRTQLSRQLEETNTRLEEAKTRLGEMEEALKEVNEAEIDPLKAKQYEEAVTEARDRLKELKTEIEEARAAAAVPIPEVDTSQGIRTRGAQKQQREAREQAIADRDAAQERLAALTEEQTATQAVLTRREQMFTIATRMNNELTETERLEREAAEALKQRLAAADAELTIARARNREAQQAASIRNNELRALQRLQQQQDRAALDAGEIDDTEFASREQARVREALAADIEGLTRRLDAIRREGDAKIEELKARRAEDASKVSEEDIQAAEIAAAQAIEAVESEIRVAAIEASAEIVQIGNRAAESFVEGFRDRLSQIGADLQTQLILLKQQLDAGVISQDEFARRSRAATDIAVEGYKQLRTELVAALEGASAEDQAAILSQIDQIDSRVQQLSTTVGEFASRLRTATEGAFADFFEEVFTDVNNIGDAFENLFRSIADQAKRLIAERLANKLITSLFGDGTEGGKPGLLSFLGVKDGGIVQAARGGYVAGRTAVNWLKLARGGSVPRTPDDEEDYRPRYKAARGGGVLKMSDGGGRVKGPGTKTSDSVRAMLSAGEYVMRAAAVDKYGVNAMEAINRGLMPRETLRHRRRLSVTRPRRTAFAEGGLVGGGANVAGSGAEGVSGALSQMTLKVDEGTLNLTMRDVLEREFGRILAQR